MNPIGKPHGNELLGSNHRGGLTHPEIAFLGNLASVLLPPAFALGHGTGSVSLMHPACLPTVLKDVIPTCQAEKVHPHPSSLRILNYFFH